MKRSDYLSILDAFFRSPALGTPRGQIRSILFLLRRDIVNLTTCESRSFTPSPRPPMPTALSIMSGFDFLAKLKTGKLEGVCWQ